MSDDEYEVIATSFKGASDTPKDKEIYYRCTECGIVIPSIPDDNIGCECGNIFIDKDYWRLVVVDFVKLEVVRNRPLAKHQS